MFLSDRVSVDVIFELKSLLFKLLNLHDLFLGFSSFILPTLCTVHLFQIVFHKNEQAQYDNLHSDFKSLILKK